MTYALRKSQLRTIRKDDPLFMVNDGLLFSPRAGFEIHRDMPNNYKRIIGQCIENGWLKPVATVTERELLFIGLNNDYR
jgi:hypothetical protein